MVVYRVEWMATWWTAEKCTEFSGEFSSTSIANIGRDMEKEVWGNAPPVKDLRWDESFFALAYQVYRVELANGSAIGPIRVVYENGDTEGPNNEPQ
jgi:hypothetical protein